jgi:hypothetical protein
LERGRRRGGSGGGAIAEVDEVVEVAFESVERGLVGRIRRAEGIYELSSGGTDGGKAVASGGAFELVGEAFDFVELGLIPGGMQAGNAIGEFGDEEVYEFLHVGIASELADEAGLW